MKRFLSLTIVLTLALGLLAASAETTLTEYAVIPEDLNATPINGSSLLNLDGGNEDALAALDGTPLSDYAYHGFIESYGWIRVTRVDENLKLYRGLMNTDGQTVIPPDYNELHVLNENWALGYMLEEADNSDYDFQDISQKDKFFKIVTVDIYHLPDGTRVATLTRAGFLDARAYDDYINVVDRTTGNVTTYDAAFSALGQVSSIVDTAVIPQYTTFNDNGLQGVMGPDGSVVFDPAYKIVYLNSDNADVYFKVGDLQHYGLCDLNGNLVVPIEYDNIQSTDGKYVFNGYACVKQGEKTGFFNVQSGEVTMPEGAHDYPNVRGLTFDDKDGDDTVIFSADGVETRLNGITNAVSYANGLYYKITNKDGKEGLIDWHGNEVLPCEYTMIYMTDDGQYLVTRYAYHDPVKVYTVANDFFKAEPEPAGEPAEEPAEEPAPAAQSDGNGQLVDDAPAPEAVQIEGVDISDQEQPAPTTNSSPVVELLNSAITLLKADPATNSAAAVSLIHNVATQIGANDSVMSQLNSVITLLNSDPAGNSAAAISLLESLIPLL